MGYDLSDRLVIGVASSALFDLTESEAVFREHGEAAYRRYSEDRLDDPLQPGVAFPFVRRILGLNRLAPDPDDRLVEVIVLSRNSPETGMRVMRSVAHHGLSISRVVFTEGQAPYDFIPAFNMALFLSADEASVREAAERGLPAGQVVGQARKDDDESDEVRIAFDFDGVLASDESERIFQEDGLDRFHAHEAANCAVPLSPGPLHRLLVAIHRIQQIEVERAAADPSHERLLQVALVTARGAPAHERAIATLKSWGVKVNDAFFLGGVEKAPILAAWRPHIFFDDQLRHIAPAAQAAPSVHVPYGVTNRHPGAVPA